MIIGAEIALFLIGLYALITGRLSSGKHVVQGWPARVIGIIGIAPVPMTFVVSIVVATLLVTRGRHVTRESFFWTGTAIEGAVVVLCAAAMGVLARVCRTSVDTSQNSLCSSAPWPTILEAIDRALRDLGAKSIKWSNDRRQVSARMSASFWSWGERLTVDTDESGEVRVSSVCEFPLQVIDWEKNARNCRKFLQALSGHLGSAPGTVFIKGNSHVQASKASNDEGLAALRKKAFRRSWLCPGAGFALLGRKILALLTFLSSLSAILSVAWAAIHPSASAVWTIIVLLLLATAFWIAEQMTVRRITSYAAGPWSLVVGYPFAVLVMPLAVGIVLVVIVTSFRALQIEGGGMSPTLEKEELFLYHKHALDEHLLRGKVIVYKLSDQSGWGQPRTLVVSRILAVPGDQLSFQNGRYLLNGELGPEVGATGRYAPVIPVPRTPEIIQVPENCYFIVQDSPKRGLDSRVLSWAQRKNIVSTRLYYLRGHNILRPVE
jgi:signal peptidase I